MAGGPHRVPGAARAVLLRVHGRGRVLGDIGADSRGLLPGTASGAWPSVKAGRQQPAVGRTEKLYRGRGDMARRRNPAVRIAQETAHNAVFDAHGNPKPGVHNLLLRAVDIQRPLVLSYIRRLQRRLPHASAAQLAARMERDYLAAVTGGGALVGATAVVPGVGTIASLGLSAAATVAFLEATALYATSLAELHGIRMTDPDKASTMVMAVMLGEE